MYALILAASLSAPIPLEAKGEGLFLVWFGRVIEVEEKIQQPSGDKSYVWMDCQGWCWTEAKGQTVYLTRREANRVLARQLREQAADLLRKAAELEGN